MQANLNTAASKKQVRENFQQQLVEVFHTKLHEYYEHHGMEIPEGMPISAGHLDFLQFVKQLLKERTQSDIAFTAAIVCMCGLLYFSISWKR